MSWITLTVDDLRRRLSPREVDAIARALGSFDDSAAQAALDGAADMARGYLRANARNHISSAPHSIPASIKADVLAVALVDLCTSVAGILFDPKNARTTAYDRAIKRWEEAAAGRYAVEQPDSAEAEPGPASSSATPPSSYTKDILASRSRQKGVL